MAQNPRKSQKPPGPGDADDLFATTPPAAAGPEEQTSGETPGSGPQTAAPDPDDEWELEEPAPSSQPRPASPQLPAQPIQARGSSFESNPGAAAAIPEALPRSGPPAAKSADPAFAPPSPASGPVPSALPAAPPASADGKDVFDDFDDGLPVPASPPVRETTSPAVEKRGPAPSSPPPSTAHGDDEEPDSAAETSTTGHSGEGDAVSEFATRPADSVSPRDPSLRPARTAKDRISLAAAAVILLALLGTFAGVLYANRPDGDARESTLLPSLPMKGEVATIGEASTGWRHRQPGDLVSAMDVTLPVPSRQEPFLLPQVSISLDGGGSKTGFLRFIFLDPDGRISGDVRVVKINGATIEPMESGAAIPQPGTAVVYGTIGFVDRPGFVGYAGSPGPRWSVEISESADYNAKAGGWTRLGLFDIRDTSNP